MLNHIHCLLLATCLVASFVSLPVTTIGNHSQAWGDAAVQNMYYQLDLAGDWQYLPTPTIEKPEEAVLAATWPSMALPSNWFLHGSKLYPPLRTASPIKVASNSVPKLLPFNPKEGLDYAGTIWFKKEFELPAHFEPKGKTPLILDLDMVDYYGEVLVNGKSLATHEGYFQPWHVNISPALQPGKNQLLIRVTSLALIYDMAQRFPISWPKNQNMVKGVFGYHDARPGATSQRGQEQNTGGILRGVALRESAGVDLERLRVRTPQANADSATAVVEGALQNWTQKPQQSEVTLTVTEPAELGGKEVLTKKTTLSLEPGEQKALSESLTLTKPALWWTWDFGKQPLYTVKAKVSLLSSEGAQPVTWQSRFGVREIKLGEGRQWLLNGKPFYFRGSNYIETQWLSQADKAWYERDLELMKKANLNTIRVHAHISRPEFYEAADEQGVLVWQDFPLQWGYADTPAFHASALRQAQDMIELYGGHASIALWSMHNEAPHAMWWMEKRDPQQNLALDNQLKALAQKLDNSRLVHRDTGTDNGHHYIGWYNGQLKLWKDGLKDIPPNELAWMTEYGAQALPSIEMLRHMLPDQDYFPEKPEQLESWKFLGFQPDVTFDIVQLDKGKSLEDFVKNSQTYQATLTQFLTELFRRQKGDPGQGTMHFMLVDCWPSISWAVVDYERNPRPGYEALRLAMQPVLPSIEYNPTDLKDPIKLWVLNDLDKRYEKAKLVWQVANQPKQERVITIEPFSKQLVADLGPIAETVRGWGHFHVWLQDSRGKVIATNQLKPESFIIDEE